MAADRSAMIAQKPSARAAGSPTSREILVGPPVQARKEMRAWAG